MKRVTTIIPRAFARAVKKRFLKGLAPNYTASLRRNSASSTSSTTPLFLAFLSLNLQCGGHETYISIHQSSFPCVQILEEQLKEKSASWLLRRPIIIFHFSFDVQIFYSQQCRARAQMIPRARQMAGRTKEHLLFFVLFDCSTVR